jgi:aspartate dehydrogenase
VGRNQRVAIIGRGAIGGEVARAIIGGEIPGYEVMVVMSLRSGSGSEDCPVVTSLQEVLRHQPDIVIEAAGVDAFSAHVPLFLAEGVDVLAISLAAMARQDTEGQVQRALSNGSARLLLASGAIGALDALSAAREGGLDRVTVVQRKPAATLLNSDQARQLVEPLIIKKSSAREAALDFPRNSNIVAAAALAGIGLDATRVTVIADPAATTNSVELEAYGKFGELKLIMANIPSPSNPRTALLPAMSIIAALRRRISRILLPA